MGSWAPPPSRSPNGALRDLRVRIVILKTQLVVIVAALVMMAGLYLFVEKTRTGKSMRAVAEIPRLPH